MRDNPQLIQLAELLGLPVRWWWTVVAGLCLGLAAGIVWYEHADKLFESETKIFVSPSEIPREFVRSTVTEDMSVRLRSLEEAVLSRSYLKRLVSEVFEIEEGHPDHERLLARVRARVTARLADFDPRRGAGLFVLTYQDTDPQRAADVANMLADLYIAENIKLRTQQAESTARTLRELAEELRVQLEAREKEIAEFRAAHLYELAENLDANLRLLAGRQADLEANDRALALALERLQLLREQRASGPAEGAEEAPAAEEDPLAARLAELEDRMASLRARYTDQHPTLRALAKEVDDLRELIAERSADSPSPDAAPPTSEIDREIGSLEREIERLRGLEAKWRGEIDLYRSRVEASPRVEQQLAELTKGYDVLLQRYERLESNYQEAKGSLRVEEARKGSQFDVVERARAAPLPVSPQRNLIYAGAAACGLLLLVGPLLARGLLSPRVVSAAGIDVISDVAVLASIDVLDTPTARAGRRRRWLANLGGAAAGLSVLGATLLLVGGIL